VGELATKMVSGVIGVLEGCGWRISLRWVERAAGRRVEERGEGR